jgi:rod shape determining protein RodA
MFKALRQFDWLLFITAVILIVFGLLAIYSATLGEAASVNVQKQIIALAIGLGLFFAAALTDYRVFRNYTVAIYILTLALLGGVLVFGENVRGATSWFQIGTFQLQPSEFAKILIIIVLARYFARYSEEMFRIRHVITSAVYALIPAGLVALQPDLGSAFLIVLIWLGMLFTSGIRRLHVYLISALMIGGSILAWFYFLADYQKERLINFLDPAADPLGSGHNVLQSIIAIGSGGFWGRGLGHGPQSQLNFLPEQHTDFIFAVVSEELGFLGAIVLLALFAFMFWRLIRAARLARDNFGTMLIIGFCVLLLFSVLINIGANLGILPVTGIPLPFVSYGGSALLASLIGLGLVESVIMRHKGVDFGK